MKKYETYNDFPKSYDKTLSRGYGDGVSNNPYGDNDKIRCNGKGTGRGVGNPQTRPDYSKWCGHYNGKGGKVKVI